VAKKHALILGAGFAGLELATRLSESAAAEVDVTLIDSTESFTFGFAKLAVMFGDRSLDEVRLPYSDISKPGVEFRRETVTAIDPASRQVETDAGSYDADILAIAMGADYDIAASPGLGDGGHEYYSVEGAARMSEVIPAFEGGRVLISILGMPFKCPPAPFEAALLFHDHFTERGIRDDVEIKVVGPQSAPVPVTSEVSATFQSALAERDIPYVPKTLITSVDHDSGVAATADGEEFPFDMFVGIPVHKVPDVIASSGLAPEGWIPVDKSNLRTEFDGVYALGDCAATPNPKAGVFAESAAIVVAEDIAATLTGGSLQRPFEGEGYCFLEYGEGRVGKVEVNFFGGPKPQAQVITPSVELAGEKRNFAQERIERWFGS
jgi:sulfide:quinone oxidoreductase